MLSITRRVGESVLVGDEILVRVVEVRGKHVRLDFDAPKEIPIFREELVPSNRKTHHKIKD